MNRGRGRSLSQLPNPNEDEILSMEKQYEFVNMTFKYGISDLENIIQMLRARLSAEESYLSSLNKVKKFTSTNDMERHHESQKSTFQTAVKLYEASINDIIESRQRLKDTIRLEIDVLVKQKELEEQNRKTFKTKLYDANNNYSTFRQRDIVKLQKAYVHKCEDLKVAQITWQEQQQLETTTAPTSAFGSPVMASNSTNRNSLDVSTANSTNRLSASAIVTGDRDMVDSSSIFSDHQPYSTLAGNSKKGMAGLISQMRTRAAAPLDQNKQMTKVSKMKKDIADADSEYRDGILMLEHLRKKQTKTMDEVNRQLQKTIQRKTETVKTSLINILRSEMDSLQMEINISHGSFDTAANIDSTKDLQLFSLHCQSLGYIKPTPVRYENYYMEGKCKEVLFGGSLETYAVEHNKTVPLLVIKCIDAIESMGGLQREGIYRISGRQANVDQLKHQFELDEDRVTAEGFDVFTIATVLKMYIRELKRPLFDFNVQTRSAYSKNMPQLQRFNLLETKLSNLSLAHRSTLYYIIRHLSKVNAHSQANKMNISNLAMIFTPVIFHDFNQTDENMPAGNPEWSPDELFEDLILHHEYLFPKSEEIARRLNEPKLHQALNGQSPFCQYSQSNLLYLMPAQQQQQQQQTTPSHPATLLLTQPMNPPMANHPPKLTTLIGTVPNSMTIPDTMTAVPVANNNSRVIANSSDARIPPPPQQHYPTSEAVVPTINYTPPETSRSKSLARESSNNNNETRPYYLPPRQDSLARKSAKNQERPITEEHQYQASLDYSLLDQRSNEIQ